MGAPRRHFELNATAVIARTLRPVTILPVSAIPVELGSLYLRFSLAFAALLLSASVAASQNAPAPRTDGEGINMDAVPPPTAEPHHPADPLAPNTANPPNVRATTG
jgi:hypothetical protein